VTTIALGAVAPYVADVADHLAQKYPKIQSISGWRASATDMAGHPAGLALDVVVGDDTVTGKQVTAYIDENAAKLHVKYRIYLQTYKAAGKAPTLMERRGGEAPGYDPNHQRHVHITFLPEVKDGRRMTTSGLQESKVGTDPVTEAVKDTVGGVGDVVSVLTSRQTWIRVGQVVGGAALVLFGLNVLMRDQVTALAGLATDVIPQTRVVKGAAKAATAVKGTAA